MSENIRYAWGQSSLGDFVTAIAHEGVVAFEFTERRSEALATLRTRFSEATMELDEAGLVDVVRKLADVIERPGLDPGIPLDIRGFRLSETGLGHRPSDSGWPNNP